MYTYMYIYMSARDECSTCTLYMCVSVYMMKRLRKNCEKPAAIRIEYAIYMYSYQASGPNA